MIENKSVFRQSILPNFFSEMKLILIKLEKLIDQILTPSQKNYYSVDWQRMTFHACACQSYLSSNNALSIHLIFQKFSFCVEEKSDINCKNLLIWQTTFVRKNTDNHDQQKLSDFGDKLVKEFGQILHIAFLKMTSLPKCQRK